MIYNEDAMPDLQAGETRTLEEGGHSFRVTVADGRAIHSDLRLFRVECATCEEVVHGQTTGPQEQIKFHLRERAVMS